MRPAAEPDHALAITGEGRIGFVAVGLKQTAVIAEQGSAPLGTPASALAPQCAHQLRQVRDVAPAQQRAVRQAHLQRGSQGRRQRHLGELDPRGTTDRGLLRRLLHPVRERRVAHALPLRERRLGQPARLPGVHQLQPTLLGHHHPSQRVPPFTRIDQLRCSGRIGGHYEKPTTSGLQRL